MTTIAVLISTYNGERFLSEQLDSILNQEIEKDWIIDIIIRDDGSSDRTMEIIQDYQKKFHNISVLESFRTGSASASFYKLLFSTSQHDYIFLCDQDDVWNKNKIKAAISSMKKIDADVPLLHYSEPCLVNEKLEILNNQWKIGKPYSLGQILVKNHVPGCTMSFNKSLFAKLREWPGTPGLAIPMHDHWIYIICRIFDGIVLYDTNSYILYRQHTNNTVGARNSLIKRIKKSGIWGRECVRSKRAELLLSMYENEISSNSQIILKCLRDYKKSIASKLRLLKQRDIKPINKKERFIFNLLTLLNRI